MDSLRRYWLRFCYFAVLLVACLMPLSAYAIPDEIDGLSSLVTVDIVSSNDEVLFTQSGTISEGIETGNSYSNQVSAWFFLDAGGCMYVDYVLTLPSSIASGSKVSIDWETSGACYINARVDADTAGAAMVLWWDKAQKTQILDASYNVLKEVDGSAPFGAGSSTFPYGWQGFFMADVPFPDGGDKLIIRTQFGADAITKETTSSWGNQTLEDYLENANDVVIGFMSRVREADMFTVYIEADESGLLSGILEIINDIREKVVGMWNAILTLPQQIWSYIESGLQALFVPDAEFMESYKVEWDTVLQDSMGGVYQSVSMIDDFYESFKVSSTQNTIHFPEVNVPVAGETFTFGGYEVDIVPDEAPFLQIVIDGIKLVMNAICTLAVLQSFKRRYERVVSE